MRVIIVRHGETEANALKLISGQTEVKLTEKGCSQAQLLGKRLSQLRFNAILNTRWVPTIIMEVASPQACWVKMIRGTAMIE